MIQDINFITDFIFVEDTISPCDVILVPGGSHPQLAEKPPSYLSRKWLHIFFLAEERI